jgi:hypothetical protein
VSGRCGSSNRHLESIRAADFLWLVCPDGYVGQSASMELGFAAAIGIPIFSTGSPGDVTLREYVNVVPTLSEAQRIVKVSARPKCAAGFLIDPHASIEQAQNILEHIDDELTKQSCDSTCIYSELADVLTNLALPTYLRLSG